MTDTSIYGRLLNIADNVALVTPLTTAEKIRNIADELLELAGNMRGRSAASLEDTSVEALGFLGEAMDQYADRLDTTGKVNPPSAGTSAYEMLAMSATAELDTIEQMVYLTAATVLAKLIDDEGGGRVNISFSPLDMDLAIQRYDLETSRDGMTTNVKLVPKPGAFAQKPPTSLYLEPTTTEDDTPAKPQVLAHSPTEDRPLWAARIAGKLFPASTKSQAEKMATSNPSPDTVSQVENRFCYHADCPAERCNHTK